MKKYLLIFFMLFVVLLSGCKTYDEEFQSADEYYYVGLILNNLNESSDVMITFNETVAAKYEFNYNFIDLITNSYELRLDWIFPGQDLIEDYDTFSLNAPLHKTFYFVSNVVNNSFYENKDWSYRTSLEYVANYSTNYEYNSFEEYVGKSVVSGENKTIYYGTMPYKLPNLKISNNSLYVSDCLLKTVSDNCYFNKYLGDDNSFEYFFNSNLSNLSSFSKDLPYYSLNRELLNNFSVGDSDSLFMEIYTGNSLWDKISVNYTFKNSSLIPINLTSINFLNYSNYFIQNIDNGIYFELSENDSFENLSVIFEYYCDGVLCGASGENLSNNTKNYSVYFSPDGSHTSINLIISLNMDYGSLTYKIDNFMLTGYNTSVTLSQLQDTKPGDLVSLSTSLDIVDYNSYYSLNDINLYYNLNDKFVSNDKYFTLPINYSLDTINISAKFEGTGLFLPSQNQQLVYNVKRYDNDSKILNYDLKVDENEFIVMSGEIANIGKNTINQLNFSNELYNNLSSVSISPGNKNNFSYKFKPSTYGYLYLKTYLTGDFEEDVSDNYFYDRVRYYSYLDLDIEIQPGEDMYDYIFHKQNKDKNIELSLVNTGLLNSQNVVVNVYEESKEYNSKTLLNSYEFDSINTSKVSYFNINWSPIYSGNVDLVFEIIDPKSRTKSDTDTLNTFVFSNSPNVKLSVSTDYFINYQENYETILKFGNLGLKNSSDILFKSYYLDKYSKKYKLISQGNISGVAGLDGTTLEDFYNPSVSEFSYNSSLDVLGETLLKFKYFSDNILKTKYKSIQVKSNSVEDFGLTIRNSYWSTYRNNQTVDLYLKRYGIQVEKNLTVGLYVKYEGDLEYSLIGTKLSSFYNYTYGSYKSLSFNFDPIRSGNIELKALILNHSDTFNNNNVDVMKTKFHTAKPDLNVFTNSSKILLPENSSLFLVDSFNLENNGLADSKYNSTFVIFNSNYISKSIVASNASLVLYNISNELYNISLNKLSVDSYYLSVWSGLSNYNLSVDLYSGANDGFGVGFTKFEDKYIKLVAFDELTLLVYLFDVLESVNRVEQYAEGEEVTQISFRIDTPDVTSNNNYLVYVDNLNDSDYSDNFKFGSLDIVPSSPYLSASLEINSALFENYIYNSFPKNMSLNIYTSFQNIGFNTLENMSLDYYFTFGGFKHYLYNPISENYYLKYDSKIVVNSSITNIVNVSDTGVVGMNFSLNYSLDGEIITSVNVSYNSSIYLFDTNTSVWENMVGDLLINIEDDELSYKKLNGLSSLNVSNLRKGQIESQSFVHAFNESGIYEVLIYSNQSVQNVDGGRVPLTKATVCIYSGVPSDRNRNFIVDQCELDIDGDGVYDAIEKTIPGNVIGNKRTVLSNKVLKLKISSFLDVYNLSFNRSEKVSVMDELTNVSYLDFHFNFTNSTLNLLNLNLELDISNQDKSYAIVSGIDTKNETKTLRFVKNSDTDKICVKDALIEDILEVSALCDGVSEFLITCDGVIDLNGYTCGISGGYFVVSGLKHSAVIEYIEPEVPEEDTANPSPSPESDSSGPDKVKTTSISTTAEIEAVVVKNKIISSNQDFKNKYDILVNSGDSADVEYTGVNRVVLKDKISNINTISFDYNFSNDNLDISNVLIIKNSELGKSYIIVSNMPKNVVKAVKLKKNLGSDYVCIRDTKISSVDEISESCTQSLEFKIKCDGSLHQSIYTCSVEADYYAITGLSHSGIIEIEKPIVQEESVLSNIEDDGEVISENIALGTKSNIKKNIFIGGIALFVIIVLVFIFVSYSNNKFLTYSNNLGKSDILVDDETQKIMEYIDMYKDQYSIQLLGDSLIKHGYNLEKVKNYINNLK